MVDVSKIDEINDENELQKLLSGTDDFDERKIIRKRLLDVKAEKSKEREKAMKELEQRREDDINERKRQRDEEKRMEIQRLDDLAKSGSTGSRLNNDMSRQREETIKEKARVAEEDRKKEIQKYEQLAKTSSAAHERNDQAVQDSIKQRAEWANEDKQRSLKNFENLSISKTKNATGAAPKTSAQKPTGAKAAFAMFQNKDVEAGGTGKASASPTNASANKTSANSPSTIKDSLLKWCQTKVQGYPNVSVNNFSSSWADGMAFCALIHQHAPDAFDFARLNPKNRRENLDLAFKMAEEKADIAPLLETDDMIMMGDKPDWKCVFTYVQSFYRKFELEPRAKAARANN